jgi:hypothetical protein
MPPSQPGFYVGKMELIVDGSWLPQLNAVNTTKGNYFWARISLSF